jgi:hypothetical protein
MMLHSDATDDIKLFLFVFLHAANKETEFVTNIPFMADALDEQAKAILNA